MIHLCVICHIIGCVLLRHSYPLPSHKERIHMHFTLNDILRSITAPPSLSRSNLLAILPNWLQQRILLLPLLLLMLLYLTVLVPHFEQYTFLQVQPQQSHQRRVVISTTDLCAFSMLLLFGLALLRRAANNEHQRAEKRLLAEASLVDTEEYALVMRRLQQRCCGMVLLHCGECYESCTMGKWE